jgi:hypothetical protein
MDVDQGGVRRIVIARGAVPAIPTTRDTEDARRRSPVHPRRRLDQGVAERAVIGKVVGRPMVGCPESG